MAKPPLSGHSATTDNLQTWILRVYIHCEGCKKKVSKVLQSIDGVYKTVIDSNQHKAMVTGSVNGETLVQKLLKSGKHAQILPESFATTAAGGNASGNSKKKKKQSNKPNDDVTVADDAELVNDEKDESIGATATGGGNDQETVNPPGAVFGDGNDNGGGYGGGGGGKKKKNKKKKGEKSDTNAPAPANGVPTAAEKVGETIEQLNLGPPIQQMAYTTPYDLPPHHSFYPTPAYGVSYSTSYPSAESSYYTPPVAVYGYAQSHPSVFDPVQQHPSSYRRSAFDDYDDEGGEGKGCAIM